MNSLGQNGKSFIMPSSEKIRQAANSLGFELVGVCSANPPQSIGQLEKWLADGMHGEMEYMETSFLLRSNLNSILPGVKSVISVGLQYYQPNETEVDQPRIARYALGRDYHKVMRGKLKQLSLTLSEDYPDHNWRPCVDSAPILEREYANRAGLGWFGKNTCLINSKRGSWFLIGSLLTTAQLDHDDPAIGGCGNCRACIDACPTGAIVQKEDRWQVDARRCISYLTIEKRGDFSKEEAAMIGDWTFGCDICQEVCPFNQPRESQPLRSNQTAEPDFLRHKSFPSLINLLELSKDQWDHMTQGSPLRRAGFDGLKRNARANLANQVKSDPKNLL